MAENDTSSVGDGIGEEDTEMSMYKKDALSVVTFRIVYNEEDYKNKIFLEFKPEMAHQVFGESESIFGYRSLSISLYYLHNSANCYVNIQYEDKIKNDLYKPDDILKSLNQWLPANFTTDSNKFKKMLENEDHDVMFGTVLNTFKDKTKRSLYNFATYKITECDLNDEKFKEYHQRFETFIVWFIDAANFIDLDDERWSIFYVYEEMEHPVTKKIYITPIGFCSIYNFFCYPNKIRPRISQFFILPSHQRRGIATQFYKTIFRRLKGMPKVADVTVEEPTAVFQKIRDTEDGILIMNMLKESKKNMQTMQKSIAIKFIKEQKICQKQAQRLYDILYCYQVRNEADRYEGHLRDIKKRMILNARKDMTESKRRFNSGSDAMLMKPKAEATIEPEHSKYVGEIQSIVKALEQKLANSR